MLTCFLRTLFTNQIMVSYTEWKHHDNSVKRNKMGNKTNMLRCSLRIFSPVIKCKLRLPIGHREYFGSTKEPEKQDEQAEVFPPKDVDGANEAYVCRIEPIRHHESYHWNMNEIINGQLSGTCCKIQMNTI